MNIIYDPEVKSLLCPKCKGKAESDHNGDLQCLDPKCGFLYLMFSDIDQSFQKELDFEYTRTNERVSQ